MSDAQKRFEPLIKPINSRRDRRLLEKRFEDEHEAELRQQLARPSAAPPPVPDAQLVYGNGHVGVAIRGASFVCPLPTGYAHGLELALIDGGRLIVTCPDMPPLLINPETGKVMPL